MNEMNYLDELDEDIEQDEFDDSCAQALNEEDLVPITKPKRMSHHYTDELELKSLLIRLKNESLLKDEVLKEHEEILKENLIKIKQDKKLNSYINSDVKRYIRIKTNIKKYAEKSEAKNQNTRLRLILENLKNRVIKNSEKTIQDKISRERFGEIVILMVKNILRKPNFQMLEYHDEFYSDQSEKIFKYMKNFDHTKISPRSGYHVNAFQYVSQIIHNSILYVINTRKKERDEVNKFLLENPFNDVSFFDDVDDDGQIFDKLVELTPLEFPFNIEDSYPFVIKDLLNFLESNYETHDELTMIEKIVDYQETSELGVTLVGDQIRSDWYLSKFIEQCSGIEEDKSQW